MSPSNEYSGLISFMIDWFISLQSKGLQESSPIPQFKRINSSALSLFYGPTLTTIRTTGKTRVLPIWTFVGKIMSLLLNTPSKFVIAFLPRG